MNPAEKIIAFADAAARFAELRAGGRRLVQCHGTFDLVHPGHILHLQQAAALGDVLVVTVTAAAHVNKGPGRPLFNDGLRAMSLAALACVDFVVVVPHPAAVEAIATVQPHVYCKGREYEDPAADLTGNILDDVAEVARRGGEIRYIGDTLSSSTRLLNEHFEAQDPQVARLCSDLASRWNPASFTAAIEGLAKLRVLVVGDTIFDRYSTVSVQGLTSKNRILSGRHLGDETHAGGALAVWRHIREFTPRVRFLSLLGCEGWLEGEPAACIDPQADATVRDPGFTTIVKQRFVENAGSGKELTKLFSVNYIGAGPVGAGAAARMEERFVEEVRHCDLVVVADFGHGMLTPGLRRRIEELAPMLALNCQTNSHNHGFNIISRQYRRADVFTLDEQELLLSCGRRAIDHGAELEGLRAQLGARAGWLTRGAVKTLGIDRDGGCAECPPLAAGVIDTVGAGDAFFSVVALAAAAGLPVDLATLIGQLAGAQAVAVVGNREPIRRTTLLKGGVALLNRGT